MSSNWSAGSVEGVETDAASESEDVSDGTSDQANESREEYGDCVDVNERLPLDELLRSGGSAGSEGIGLSGCDVGPVGMAVCAFVCVAMLNEATDSCTIGSGIMNVRTRHE